MKYKYYRFYALPLGIMALGVVFYFVAFDSFNVYRQNYAITITENALLHDNDMLEQSRMREEIQKIKESANTDFIIDTLTKNINHITHADTNIEFYNERSNEEYPLQKPHTKAASVMKQPKKIDSITYTPYRFIGTHTIESQQILKNPNSAMPYNPNTTTKSYTVVNKSIASNQYVFRGSKHAKIYKNPNTSSKIIVIGKQGENVQVLKIQDSWFFVRYIAKNKSIYGYVPMQALRIIAKS